MGRRIQILGIGCPSCDKLAERTQVAAETLGMDFELEKVTRIMQIAEFGVMMTPALVVDGEVKTVGYVPSVDEIKAILAGEQPEA